jgi:hypothetical protein
MTGQCCPMQGVPWRLTILAPALMFHGRRGNHSGATWYPRLIADGGFIPLLAKLFGLLLPVPSRAEKVSGDGAELRLQI